MRIVLDGIIVGAAALGVAGVFDKFLPKVKLGPVNIPAYLGAGLGAGITLFFVTRV